VLELNAEGPRLRFIIKPCQLVFFAFRAARYMPFNYITRKGRFNNMKTFFNGFCKLSNDMSSRDVSKEERGPHSPHDKPSKLLLRPPADLSFVAQYLNQDPDLWVFRRFGKLHLFNILCLQQRLAELENALETKIWNNETDGFDELLSNIKVGLKEYGTAAYLIEKPGSLPSFSVVKLVMIMSLT